MLAFTQNYGGMKLREYLDRSGESVTQFAKRIAVHPSTVYRWLENPPTTTEKRIVEGTCGVVSADDLLGTTGVVAAARKKRKAA